MEKERESMRPSCPVNILDKDRNLLFRFQSALEAGKYFGYSPNSIRNLTTKGALSKFNKKIGGKFYCVYAKTVTGGELTDKEAEEFVRSKNKIAERMCLMCGHKFNSNGPHNRRCATVAVGFPESDAQGGHQ